MNTKYFLLLHEASLHLITLRRIQKEQETLTVMLSEALMMMNDKSLLKWALACILQAVLFVMHIASFPQKEQEGKALRYFSPAAQMFLESFPWTGTWCKTEIEYKTQWNVIIGEWR